jgi:chromosome segregation ATPase
VEQIRIQSEQDIETLLQKKMEASKEAEEWERRYWNLKDEISAEVGDKDSLKCKVTLLERKNLGLEGKNRCLQDEIVQLKEKLSELTEDVPPRKGGDDNCATESVDVSAKNDLSAASVLSPAPPAVLSELNRTRMKLADVERINRQLSRKMDKLQSEANQMIEYRELSQNATKKLHDLENELKIVRRERASLRIVEARWIEFRKELVKNNLGREILDGGGDENENMPPEIASLVRQYRTLEDRAKEAEKSVSMLHMKLDAALRRSETLEKSYNEINDKCAKASEEKASLAEKLLKAETVIESVKAQERIWKRETESIRSLLGTYKEIEDKMVQSRTAYNSDATDASATDAMVKSLKLSLSSAQEENSVLRKQIEATSTDNQILSTKMEALKQENESVRSKFIKIRDALFQEKEQVEKAEERAAEAEILVGKGGFNQDLSRVLHFKENPLYKAIKEKNDKNRTNWAWILGQNL